MNAAVPLRAAAVAVTVALSACIVVPQTREVYDPECRMLTRQMTLQMATIGGFQRCAGDGCLALLTAVGAVTAASAVVSGSIALVGSAVYWFERQGQCQWGTAAATATPAAILTGSPAASPTASLPTAAASAPQ